MLVIRLPASSKLFFARRLEAAWNRSMNFFSKLKEGLRTGKDLSTSLIAKKFIQEQVSPYGHITDLSLDSRIKELRVLIQLNGEAQPLLLHIQRYELSLHDQTWSIVIRQATASKPWIAQALTDFVLDHSFPIPQKYNSIVSKIL